MPELIEASPIAKALDDLPSDELLIAAVKSVLIAVPAILECVLQHRRAIITTCPQAAGMVINACAQAIETTGDGLAKADELRAKRAMLTQTKWDEVFSFKNLIDPKFEA